MYTFMGKQIVKHICLQSRFMMRHKSAVNTANTDSLNVVSQIYQRPALPFQELRTQRPRWNFGVQLVCWAINAPRHVMGKPTMWFPNR